VGERRARGGKRHCDGENRNGSSQTASEVALFISDSQADLDTPSLHYLQTLQPIIQLVIFIAHVIPCENSADVFRYRGPISKQI